MPRSRSNREKILTTSVQLFNRAGVGTSSTNHISAAAGVSPGNLYYHFKDKEEILRHLFAEMAERVETLWMEPAPPETFFRSSLGLVWRYRFFHREMYPLRRQDVKLNRLWRRHLATVRGLLDARVEEWLPADCSSRQVEQLSVTILTFFTSFVHVYESGLVPLQSKHRVQALRHLLDLIPPEVAAAHSPLPPTFPPDTDEGKRSRHL